MYLVHSLLLTGGGKLICVKNINFVIWVNVGFGTLMYDNAMIYSV
jgi:hypothetical protein